MRIMTRYVTFEFLKIFTLALLAITAFTLIVGVGTEAVKEGLSLAPLVRIVPFILPIMMRFSIPAAALLAACALFGRMSGDNEILATKSLGISPFSVALPAIVSGFLISIVAVWINDVAVSWGKPGAERVITESIEQIAYGMLRTRGSFQSERLSIIVKAVEGRRLIRPVIKIKPDRQSEEYVVTANAAELRRNAENNTLSIILTDPAIESDRFSGNINGEFENVIDLPTGRRDARGERNPADFAIHELPDERARQSQAIANLEGLMAVDAAFRLVAGNLQGLTGEQWVVRLDARQYAKQRINRLRTEPWRRWANGFSCFSFVMAGIPLSIRMRHADLITSFFTTFVPILLVYYPLMTYGVDGAKDGNLPQYACWLGNLVILCWGLWMLRRVMRY